MVKRLVPRERNGAEAEKNDEEEEATEFINEKCACPPSSCHLSISRPAEKCFFYAKLDILEGSFPTAVHSQPAIGIWSPSESL